MSQEQPVGRPSKVSTEVTDMLLEQIQLGQSYKMACQRAGIHYSNFRRWIKKGEKAKTGEYREFCDRLKEAEAMGTESMLENIRRAGNKGHWQADAWILERRHPEDFGRSRSADDPPPERGDVNVNVNVDARQQRPDYSNLSDEELKTHVELLRKIKAREANAGSSGDRSGAFPSRN